MSRTKGARNKTAVRTLDEQIAAVTAEIEALQGQIKKKKDDLKRLKEEKEKADSQLIMKAIAASGKSMEEILTLLGVWPEEQGGIIQAQAQISSENWWQTDENVVNCMHPRKHDTTVPQKSAAGAG